MLVESYNREYDDVASNRREMSAEDRKWLEIIEKGVRTVGGSYEVPLPLCDNHGPLPETRDIGLRRMHSLRKKLVKDGNYSKQYSAFITEMQQKGYAEQVTTATPGNVWYSIFLYFGVQHPDKPDKVRVVFDCASKVQVPEHQRDYLRFFWRENSLEEELREWRVAVHQFGACSSPSIANFVLKQTASDFGNEFSEGARFKVANNFYVDDCLRAEDSKDALLVNLLEVKELCKKGDLH
ncbi:uncharacterized protein [Palaemon carinicauda]|uniref:uncharacterized protein n=1 Tax=Palaemon carinicauda TaxID=392227 RepID=UPI0035B5A820